MATQVSTLDKLRILETLYHRGYQSDVIDHTVDKVIALERDRAERESAELETHLRAFETRYHMSSENFYDQFHKGELGDSADFFEWSAFYTMYQSVQERLRNLD